MSDDRAAILWLIRIMAIRGNEKLFPFRHKYSRNVGE